MADGLKLTAALVAFISITIAVSGLFNNIQPTPYMDEIFHIPQAQHFCSHNFSHWDNKITTLPGLYIVSLMMMNLREVLPLKGLLATNELCSTMFLRSVNVFFMFGNFWLFYELSFIIQSEFLKRDLSTKTEDTTQVHRKGKQKRKNPKGKTKGLSAENIGNKKTKGLSAENIGQIPNMDELNSKSFVNSLVLAAFPLLYFFTFMYYTDQGSTFMVLLMYWFGLQGSHTTAALTGAVAIIFRQTNIIWVAFVAGVSLLRIIEKDLLNSNYGINKFISTLFYVIGLNLKIFIHTGFPYLCIALAFVVFVIKNNGIVVGDRSSHRACLHIPQAFYFIGFSMVMSSPMFTSVDAMTRAIDLAKRILKDGKKLVLAVAVVMLMSVTIYKLTYAHEYLLADNRHFTFYIWKKICQRHWTVKYLLIPGYLYGGYTMQRNLAIGNSGLWILLYTIAVCLVTVPQKLLEFRYFIIPYLMFRLHAKIPSFFHLAMESVIYAAVNAITIILFLYKPFHLENETSEQRFMW